MGTYFRSPKTANEQRASDGHRQDGIKVRASRRSVNLPDSWDDIYRSVIRDRSWKRHRPFKWRPSAAKPLSDRHAVGE